MTTYDRINKLPQEHKLALASLLSIVAEKYLEAVEKEATTVIK